MKLERYDIRIPTTVLSVVSTQNRGGGGGLGHWADRGGGGGGDRRGRARVECLCGYHSSREKQCAEHITIYGQKIGL